MKVAFALDRIKKCQISLNAAMFDLIYIHNLLTEGPGGPCGILKNTLNFRQKKIACATSQGTPGLPVLPPRVPLDFINRCQPI